MLNGGNGRRVVSSDRESVRTVPRESTRRIGPQPAGRRIVPGVGRRGSSVDGLDSSFSESEGINGEMDQVRNFSTDGSKKLECFCLTSLSFLVLYNALAYWAHS
jgi:hypothetical protein